MAEKKLSNVAFKCHHCHQTTYMQILGSASRDITSDHPRLGQAPNQSHSQAVEMWEILLCPNCDKANVHYCVWLDNQLVENSAIIHPPAITYEAPRLIDLQFRSAIAVIHVNPAAAVNQFRVVLEMIWDEHIPHGTKKPTALRGNSGKIQQLVDKNILFGSYADMADVLAYIGDKGSHSSAAHVTREDAELARQLCQTILEHVYRMRLEGSDLIQHLESKFPRDAGWRDGKYVDKANW